MEEENAREVSSPGGLGSDKISKSEEIVCGNSSVSCVDGDEAKCVGVGADVRVPISGGGRMINTRPCVPAPQTREMKPELPLSLMQLIGRTEDWGGREIVLVADKTRAEMTGETGQQNKDPPDGDVDQDGGRGRGCHRGRQVVTSVSSQASSLPLKPGPSVRDDKELCE